MNLINSGTLKKGSAILWDDAGPSLSSRNWQSATNKMINFLLQTFRHKNFILVFTSPYMDFIDAATRKLFHAEFTVMDINYDKQTTRIKPQLIQYNSRRQKFYYKYLRIAIPNKGVYPIKEWHIKKPTEDLLNEYEILKTQFTEKLNKDILYELDIAEEKRSPEKKLTEKQENVLKLMAKHSDVKKVAEIIGITTRVVYDHLRLAQKKGYSPLDFPINEV